MPQSFDLVCLSHLRWDFVYQRPQHLLSRFARHGRVFFVEEPIFDAEKPSLELRVRQKNVVVAVPHLPVGTPRDGALSDYYMRALADELYEVEGIDRHVLWYYTPMALAFTRHLDSAAVVYDCMDELSAFLDAPTKLSRLEDELFDRADLVFTGGHSLYEAKRTRHDAVYAFPSAVDVAHFAHARGEVAEPDDQGVINRPRLGFFGVIDERMDLDLVAGIAEAQPDWQLVMVGPVTKIEPSNLPRHANIHYLGPKGYDDLPGYVAGWDVALMPFAQNESTRFISPTKTPEYLAAGKPVVSTPIRDVVRPYGEKGLVRIADGVPGFVNAIRDTLREDGALPQARADAFLRTISWERTWSDMRALVERAIERNIGGVRVA